MEKIAVIGGGPAGLCAAIEGAKNGLRVTLYEKNKIGENISCAEGFFDTLNTLGEPKYGVKYKVEEIVLQLKSCYSFTCDEKMNIWMIDKGEWQKGLAHEARELGVDIIENCHINKNMFERIKADNIWIIDATGAPSITSTVYGFSNFYSATSAVAVQYTLEGDFRSLLGKFKIGMEKHLIGYYWIFPKTENIANVGIGWLENSKENLWNELDRVLQKEGMAGNKKLKKTGGVCPIKRLDRLVYGNILLAGDAAGLVSPLHGGGIDTACISGKLAVQSIIDNKVKNYEGMIDTVLGKKLTTDKLLFELWRDLDYNNIEEVIKYMSNNRFMKIKYSSLFNGEFKLYKYMKYFKNVYRLIGRK